MSTDRADTGAALPADPFLPQAYRVAGRRRELADTVTLTLMPVAGKRPDFEPGQFNMLYVAGVGEIAVSVSANGAQDNGFAHTIRDVGAVSAAIVRIAPGAQLGLRGPFGTGWPMEAAKGRDVVIVAGGLGLAPLRPAIRKILTDRHRYGRVVILFGTRNPREMLYRHELEQWRQLLDVDLEVTVDHAGPDWRGNVGVVPALIPRTKFDPTQAIAMVCGPEVMMRFSVAALRDVGVAPEHIYLSMERNMKCAIGLCGHCQFGPDFVCKEGPVMRYDRIASIFAMREV